MKNSLLLFGMLLLMMPLQAQISIGIKGGLNTTSIAPEELEITNLDDAKQFGISVKDADYGMHFGFYVQGLMGKFIFRPEFVFNSNKVNYNVKEFALNSITQTVKSETYQYFDIPVMMGAKLGALRLMGGPVGHVFINSKSDLFNVEGYKQKFEELTYGWQAGLGLDFWRFVLDLKYEGNFNKFGDHMVIGNHQYNFDNAPTRFIVSLGFRL